MNKVALITGSARGIGKATAIKFASKGYDVVINYIESSEEAQEVKNYIESNYNVKVLTIKADVSDETQVKNMIDEIISSFGHIDALVNNAGIAYDRDFNNITIEEFETF